MNLIQLLKTPVFLLIYLSDHASKLVKRDYSKWVYGCHFKRYEGNSKFLFQEANDSHPEIRSIWISHNKSDVNRIRALGFECYYWLTIKGLFHCLTAGVYVCTSSIMDVNCFLSGNAKMLDLHHGIGIKLTNSWKTEKFWKNKFGKPLKELERSILFKLHTYIFLYRKRDICLATSETHAREFWCQMYRISLDDCIFGNFPRNKILLKDKKRIMEMGRRYEPDETREFINTIQEFKKVYIYMPTWRNDGNNFIEAAQLDFKKLNDALLANDALLIMKLHPATKLDCTDIESFTNIQIFNNCIDVYYILPFTDCLITDYSSIYTDYLIMNKEVILFTFDKEDYIRKSFDLKDFDTYYKGKVVKTFEELLYLIQHNIDCHIDRGDYKFLMDYFWGSINNPLDIVEEVKKLFN